MLINRVAIQQFRNIRELSLEFEPGLNFILGPNGAGKTSCLEALAMVSTIRSFRGARPEDMIQESRDRSHIVLESREEDRRFELTLVRGESGRIQKTALINGKPFGRTSEYLKQRFGPKQSGLHAIVFSPSQIELATGEPSLRRDFLQSVLIAEDPGLIDVFRRYGRALEQRNALLKQGAEGLWGAPEAAQDPFLDELHELGATIVSARLEWLERFANALPEALGGIVDKKLGVTVGYRSNYLIKTNNYRDSSTIILDGQYQRPPIEIIHESLRRASAQWLSLERLLGTTQVGPHRDDWSFWLDGRELKRVASQGETRAVILALKLSELSLFRSKTGFSPLLLVDDFSSELDAHRRGRLLRHLESSGVQTLVTATEAAEAIGKRYQLLAGNSV